MAALSLPLHLLLLLCAASVSFPRSFAAAAAPLCPRSDLAFVDDLRSWCPRWIEMSSPREVDGETLDRELSRGEGNGYYSVLLYASQCRFSCNILPTFDVLSSMFPQIKHLIIEESSTMPSILSRYGIHSFPAIMLSNRTAIFRYHGAKDLSALVQYYKETTGFDPIADLVVNQPSNSGIEGSLMHQAESFRDLMNKEPYVVLGALFICLKIVLSLLTAVFSLLKALCVAHARQMNLHGLRESSQLLIRMLQVIDVKKLWSKLKLGNKTRNLSRGANNARAWASTLTSVSLGESSCSRLAPSDS